MNQYTQILKKHHIKLNKAQLAAATEFFGPLSITAYAGCGKTSTVIARITLLQELQPQANILALSFSKKSCEELNQRLDSSYGTQIATIHSFLYNRVLRASGFYNNFRFISNEAERRCLLKKALYESHTEDYLLVKDLLEALASGIFDSEEKIAASEAYFELLKENKLLDFDSILYFAKEILETTPAVGHHIRRTIDYIVIDEMQDTNKTSCQCIRLLFPAEQCPNICFVWDIRQSIYKFSGACPESVSELINDYYYAKEMKLTMNYRSTENIISVVNEVIPATDTKLVAASKEAGSQPVFYAAATPEEEAKFVINKMKEYHDKQGYSYTDMAILFRASVVTDILYETMLEKKIPFIRVGSSALKYNNSRFKAAYAMLGLLYSSHPSLVMGCALPILGASSGLVEYIKANEISKSGQKLSELLTSIPSLSKNQRARFKAFFDIDIEHNTLDEVVRLLYKEYLQDYFHVKDDSVLLELLDIIGSDRTYDELSHHIATVRKQEKAMKALAYKNKDRAVLSSIHSAKGMEWPIVFIVGASASIMPLCRADSNIDEAEEHRLAYVAASRAQKELIVSYPVNNGQARSQSCSPYFAKFFNK